MPGAFIFLFWTTNGVLIFDTQDNCGFFVFQKKIWLCFWRTFYFLWVKRSEIWIGRFYNLSLMNGNAMPWFTFLLVQLCCFSGYFLVEHDIERDWIMIAYFWKKKKKCLMLCAFFSTWSTMVYFKCVCIIYPYKFWNVLLYYHHYNHMNTFHIYKLYVETY